MEDNFNLKEIILEVSNKQAFNSLLLEKDYYLTKFLIELSNNPINNLVFKGGTCLNKCYLGFYRLSEDLDFIYNENLNKLTNRQLKIKTEDIRKKLYSLLTSCGFKVDHNLGLDWKKITKDNRVINQIIYAKYRSVISEKEENIKLEISYRNKLFLKTKNRQITHLFYNKLNLAILEENKNIECIDIVENLAEKYRALVTRQNIALRDIYDIGYILEKEEIKIDNSFIDLIIKKIEETKPFTKQEFFEFIKNLNIDKINKSLLDAVLRSDIDLDKELENKFKLVKIVLKKLN
ncbi:MAG: nucleotidyl transferase AbiEii/AbiGii toxin family protein [archaeon]